VTATLSTVENSIQAVPIESRLRGKRVGMVVFSSYPHDARPRRAVDALLQEGMIVDLICEAEGDAPKRESIGNLNIIRIPIPRTRGGKLSYAYQYLAFIAFSAWIFAVRALRKRYDLMYVHNMPDVLVISALLPKILGAKVILDQHDPMPELMTTIFNLPDRSLSVRIIRLLEKWSLARANLVITVNAACKRIFSERGCPPGKIGVVMNTPDEELFPYRASDSYPPSREDGRPFVIMYHGSIVERNGLELAVDALALVKDKMPGAELRIFGKNSAFLEHVLNKARNLGLEQQIRFLGVRRLEELSKEIQSCDVGIIPNQRNAFTDINTPVRIFEYLALGKPVVAPRTPGIQDYFDPQSLFFFESGNSEDLANQLLNVFSSPNITKGIAERGQQVYTSHTWHEERKTLLRLVSTVLGVPA
jgi:glycosyltransferase involved in cell wall biosynthesis